MSGNTPSRRAIEEAERVLYDEGTKIRQDVFGPGHIAQSKALPQFMQPIQSMAVNAGWSMVWSREGLDRRTRSLLCLVMLAVLGRDHELEVHVRGAISNGCTQDEIREALLQVSVYAGVPASLNATKIAWRVLEALEPNGKTNGHL